MIASKYKIILAGIIGNIIEYYDFALIGFMADVIGKLFFPSSNAFLSLISAFLAFGLGMVVRPLGSIFFGHIGDRIGRRFALLISLAMMALPTFLIGILPTFSSIGIFAPILLILLRIVQGFSVGGEYSSSIVYLVEQAPKNYQNVFGSLVSVGAKLGMALGSFVCLLLIFFFGKDFMFDWGWRIPFLLSLILAIAGFSLRRNMVDIYSPKQKEKAPIIIIYEKYQKRFLHFLLMGSFIWIAYYTLFIFLPTWLQTFASMSKEEASTINTLSIILAVFMIFLSGLLADKIGAKKIMKISTIGFLIAVYPAFFMMKQGSFILSTISIMILVVFLTGIQAPFFSLVVNAVNYKGVRASFTAIVLGFSAGVFGGLTPAFMITLIEITGSILSPAYLLMGTSLLLFFLVCILKKDKESCLP